VKFVSELRDATCQWDHTVVSATRQRSPQPGRLVLDLWTPYGWKAELA